MKLPQSTSIVKTIFLSNNSDGVCPLKSVKLDFYPVWFQILNLTSVDRSRCRNLILAALFAGRGKPNWERLFENIRRDMEVLQKGETVSVNGKCYVVSFNCPT